MYEIEWTIESTADTAKVHVFARKLVIKTVEQFRHQAEMPTRQRKPLRRPIPDLPEATWEARVAGEYRILYCIKEGPAVRVLRVILKGTAALAQAIRRSKEP